MFVILGVQKKSLVNGDNSPFYEYLLLFLCYITEKLMKIYELMEIYSIYSFCTEFPMVFLMAFVAQGSAVVYIHSSMRIIRISINVMSFQAMTGTAFNASSITSNHIFCPFGNSFNTRLVLFRNEIIRIKIVMFYFFQIRY